MSTKVRKLIICDRCGASENAPAVSSYLPGWGRVYRVGLEYETRDTCSECTRIVLAVIEAGAGVVNLP